jgi:superfamily II DNA or RNA helicase
MEKLYDHQQKLVDEMPRRHVLAHEVGTGKTTTSLAMAHKAGYRTLVICPKALKEHWVRKARQYKVDVSVYSKEEFKKHVKDIEKFETVIVDEAHWFFGMKSQLNKSLKWYLHTHKPEYVWFLTGTAYRSTPWDIYVMCILLGKQILYPVFRNQFFYERRFGPRVVPVIKEGIEEELNAIVKEVGSIVLMSDCADVPEQTYSEEYLTLTKEQKKAISELEDITPIGRYSKEHQICGGTLKDSGKRYDTPKVERVKELVAENKHVIVVCRYNEELDMLEEELSSERKVFVIRGDVKNKDEVIQNLSKEDPWVLLVNAKCSEGWEVPWCPLMVFYSYDFELKNYIQMMGRIQRMGHLKKNVYHSLIIADSVDEGVYDSMMKKEDFHIAIYTP